jgi:hypothetical protein
MVPLQTSRAPWAVGGEGKDVKGRNDSFSDKIRPSRNNALAMTVRDIAHSRIQRKVARKDHM